jgi:hypothetical protein
MKLYQILRTTPDVCGNPRRLTCVYAGPGDDKAGCLIEVIEHGYSGNHIPDGAFTLPSLDVPLSEYHATKRYAKICSFCTFTNNN